MPGGDVDLRARWSILGNNGRKVLSKAKSSFTEPIGGDTIAEMVSAQSRLVARLSLEIAEEIKRLEETTARQSDMSIWDFDASYWAEHLALFDSLCNWVRRAPGASILAWRGIL